MAVYVVSTLFWEMKVIKTESIGKITTVLTL